MTALILAMAGILLLAGLIVTYVAYPHRGREVPAASWLSRAMRRGVRSLPTLDEREQEALRQAELQRR